MQERYDVVIAGGAFSGAATAILIRRDLPDLRVLIVEKAEAFDEKVGEATTEMSAMFLTRRLAMWHHLEAEQLPKEGLRYWFSNSRVTGHTDASESGGFLRSAVPSFQLRRDALDEYLLTTAIREGAEIFRPARVLDVQIGDFDNKLTIDHEGTKHEISCRWLIDATGRANLIGRRLNLIERNDQHPTAAMWCRWRNVRNIDDLAARDPHGLAARNVGSRRLGTNHYMGFGYWIWVIPLGNGETSIGVVFDKRLVDLHRSTARERDFIAFLEGIPALAELIDGASPRLEDFRFYSHLPYATKQYMGRGWSLVGDAASFLDPYYSPGLDHAAFSVEATVEILKRDVAGESLDAVIAEHNLTFVRSYWRFFRAAFVDKYYYMGESDLLTASFLLDTAHYYLFVVMPAYRVHKRFHWMPVLGPKGAFFSYHLMALYNRRFKSISMARRAAGEADRRNDRRRVTAYFNLGFAPVRMAARGMRLWLFAEADNVRLQVRRLFGRGAGSEGGQRSAAGLPSASASTPADSSELRAAGGPAPTVSTHDAS